MYNQMCGITYLGQIGGKKSGSRETLGRLLKSKGRGWWFGLQGTKENRDGVGICIGDVSDRLVDKLDSPSIGK